MPSSQAVSIVVFLGLQACLIAMFFCIRCRKIIHYTRVLQISAFLCMEALCVTLFLLGGIPQVKDKLVNVIQALERGAGVPTPEAFEISGDPFLVHWVQSQKPNLPRPDFTSPSGLRKWQDSLHRTLVTEIFKIPDVESPVEVHTQKLSSTMVDSHTTRIFLSYQSFDGTSIPAYLFLPPATGRKPAILVLHGHLGDDEGQGITQTAGIVDSYQHGNALELARAGFITLTIEFRGFGYLGAGTKGGHEYVAYNALLSGSFYKAIVSRDIKYAVDLLGAMDEVDPQRIGITGASYGGEMAVTYAALDRRIKAVVFQAFGGNLGVQPSVGIREHDIPFQDHMIPGHNLHMHQEDLFLLIAPRPLLGIRGDQDSDSTIAYSETIGAAYRCLGIPSAFQFSILPGGHEYFVRPAAEFFKQYL